MLTAEQRAVIEKIPQEGAAEYDFEGTRLNFSQADIENTAAKAFTGTLAPIRKNALIMLGAPGTGKTRKALQIMEAMPSAEEAGTILVAYNEGGAETFFEPFQRELASARTLAERARVQAKYQPVTQRIQNTILKRALRQQFSLVMDITAAGPGAKHLINALRGVGYDDIRMVGIFAPFNLCAQRATERRRPSSAIDDIVGKRSGSLQWMPSHAAMVNRFDLYYNDRNGAEPLPALTLENGVATKLDRRLTGKIWRDIADDYADIRAYLATQPVDAEKEAKLLADYTDAAQSAGHFIQEAEARLLSRRGGPAPA